MVLTPPWHLGRLVLLKTQEALELTWTDAVYQLPGSWRFLRHCCCTGVHSRGAGCLDLETGETPRGEIESNEPIMKLRLEHPAKPTEHCN